MTALQRHLKRPTIEIRLKSYLSNRRCDRDVKISPCLSRKLPRRLNYRGIAFTALASILLYAVLSPRVANRKLPTFEFEELPSKTHSIIDTPLASRPTTIVLPQANEHDSGCHRLYISLDTCILSGMSMLDVCVLKFLKRSIVIISTVMTHDRGRGPSWAMTRKKMANFL